MNFKLGVYSLGERIPDASGNTLTAQQRIESIHKIQQSGAVPS